MFECPTDPKVFFQDCGGGIAAAGRFCEVWLAFSRCQFCKGVHVNEVRQQFHEGLIVTKRVPLMLYA
jgi:hypothetical protein